MTAGLAAVAVVAVVAPGAAGAETTVASCAAPDETGYAVGPGVQELAQSFTVADAVTVDAIRLHLGNPFANSGDFVVRIVTLSETGTPSSTILAEGTLPLSSIPNSDPNLATVSFTAPADLAAGGLYALTVSKTGTGPGTAYGSDGDTCTGGNAFVRSDPGSAWMPLNPGFDIWFELRGAPTDSDGDGVPDVDDACPAVPGPASHNGCPLDTDPPETTITRAPGDTIHKPKVKFRFVSDEPGSTFECRLKGPGLPAAVKRFRSCTSPRRYKHLKPGTYRFKVRATDPAGNTDPTPAKARFSLPPITCSRTARCLPN